MLLVEGNHLSREEAKMVDESGKSYLCNAGPERWEPERCHGQFLEKREPYKARAVLSVMRSKEKNQVVGRLSLPEDEIKDDN